MRALRYVYILALVVWLGGMVVLGAVVAPATFQVLQASAPATGRELGGAVFTAILERFHYIAYASGVLLLVTLAAMALLGPRPSGLGARTALVAAMLAVALYSGFIVLRNADGAPIRVARVDAEWGSVLDDGAMLEAIDRVRPFAVDVSSGVEAAPGVKSRARMEAFFEAIEKVKA